MSLVARLRGWARTNDHESDDPVLRGLQWPKKVACDLRDLALRTATEGAGWEISWRLFATLFILTGFVVFTALASVAGPLSVLWRLLRWVNPIGRPLRQGLRAISPWPVRLISWPASAIVWVLGLLWPPALARAALLILVPLATIIGGMQLNFHKAPILRDILPTKPPTFAHTVLPVQGDCDLVHGDLYERRIINGVEEELVPAAFCVRVHYATPRIPVVRRLADRLVRAVRLETADTPLSDAIEVQDYGTELDERLNFGVAEVSLPIPVDFDLAAASNAETWNRGVYPLLGEALDSLKKRDRAAFSDAICNGALDGAANFPKFKRWFEERRYLTDGLCGADVFSLFPFITEVTQFGVEERASQELRHEAFSQSVTREINCAVYPDAVRSNAGCDEDPYTSEDQNRAVLVYIHGFNESFEKAAIVAAQMAVDLDYSIQGGQMLKTSRGTSRPNRPSFRLGVPVLYSWPNGENALSYLEDRRKASQSAHDLERFLMMLAADPAIEEINIVIHSMGNRMFVDSLRDFAVQYLTDPFEVTQDGTRRSLVAADNLQNLKRIRIVHAAAEVTQEDYNRVSSSAAQTVGAAAEVLEVDPETLLPQVAIYKRESDLALVLARIIDRGERLGQIIPWWQGRGEPSLTPKDTPNIDTIDSNAYSADPARHGYFANNGNILNDIACFFQDVPAEGTIMSTVTGAPLQRSLTRKQINERDAAGRVHARHYYQIADGRQVQANGIENILGGSAKWSAGNTSMSGCRPAVSAPRLVDLKDFNELYRVRLNDFVDARTEEIANRACRPDAIANDAFAQYQEDKFEFEQMQRRANGRLANSPFGPCTPLLWAVGLFVLGFGLLILSLLWLRLTTPRFEGKKPLAAAEKASLAKWGITTGLFLIVAGGGIAIAKPTTSCSISGMALTSVEAAKTPAIDPDRRSPSGRKSDFREERYTEAEITDQPLSAAPLALCEEVVPEMSAPMSCPRSEKEYLRRLRHETKFSNCRWPGKCPATLEAYDNLAALGANIAHCPTPITCPAQYPEYLEREREGEDLDACDLPTPKEPIGGFIRFPRGETKLGPRQLFELDFALDEAENWGGPVKLWIDSRTLLGRCDCDEDRFAVRRAAEIYRYLNSQRSDLDIELNITDYAERCPSLLPPTIKEQQTEPMVAVTIDFLDPATGKGFPAFDGLGCPSRPAGP